MGHHPRAIQKLLPKCEFPYIWEGQKAKGFLSWACFFNYCSQFFFCTKGIIIFIDPTKDMRVMRGGAQKANREKKKKKTFFFFFLSSFLFPIHAQTNIETIWRESHGVQVLKWSAHTRSSCNGVCTQTASIQRHGARGAMCKELCMSYVIVMPSSVVPCAALQHCIAFNVFHVLFWFTLHSGIRPKLGYFITSIIGHNIYVIFIALWNNCWVFHMLPQKVHSFY